MTAETTARAPLDEGTDDGGDSAVLLKLCR